MVSGLAFKSVIYFELTLVCGFVFLHRSARFSHHCGFLFCFLDSLSCVFVFVFLGGVFRLIIIFLNTIYFVLTFLNLYV